MTSPDLIVIGAQKCGTTTLYEDLSQHPQIRLTEKESSHLLAPDAIQSRELYSRTAVPSEGRLVEVSTEYAMRPLNEPARRAHEVAPDAHIVYIVRDPIARLISHHHHEVAARTMVADIEEAVRTVPRLVDYSRYAYQLEPWLEAYGPQQVTVLKFEGYMADRDRGVSSVHALMGLPEVPLEDATTQHNAATTKRVAVGMGGVVARSSFYRDFVRPRIPEGAKARAKAALLPKAPPRPAPPSQETLDRLVAELTPEVEALASLISTAPWWNLEEKWSA